MSPNRLCDAVPWVLLSRICADCGQIRCCLELTPTADLDCCSNLNDLLKVQTVVGAFVMPNAPIEPDMPLTSFAVPLEALESASGLRFFPVRGIF